MCEELGHNWARQVEDLHLSWAPHSHRCNARACTHTCSPKPIACSNSLGFVHPTRKGKAREDLPFVVLSPLVNPLVRSRGHTNTASWTRASSPLVTHRSCLVASLTANPGPRAQHQPETSWNSSVSVRIREHRPELSGALSQQHMGTVTLRPPPALGGSCPVPAASPPRRAPRAARSLSLCIHLRCTITPVRYLLGCRSQDAFLTYPSQNQICWVPFSLFAFNIFMCFSRSCPYLLVCFFPSSSSVIPNCCCWKIKRGQ